MSKKKNAVIWTSSIVGVLVIAVLLGLIFTGLYIGWGPFTYLQFDQQEKAIVNKYDAKTRKNEIIFYGASNFRLWTEMDNDLSEYKVQNHGFGGCTDKDLVARADTLLYPYEPQVVFFQTGSNDYVSLSGTDEEKTTKCIDYKKEMFSTFREKLPNAYFVLMSGLLLPGRSQYTDLKKKINSELKTLCSSSDYMYFVDAGSMTFDGNNYREDLFREDKIHLNHDGELLWCKDYIKPEIASLIEEHNLTGQLESCAFREENCQKRLILS